MTSADVIRYDELQPAPWQNGQGVTRTIRAMPAGGGWSLSIATIEQRAEFSIIPRTQRVQLAIDAVRLEIDRREVTLGPGEQARFDGTQHVVGASVAGSSQVLNLMYSHASPALEMALVRDARELSLDSVAVVVLVGELICGPLILGHFDTAVLEGRATAAVSGGRGLFAVVRAASRN
ncbi:hypothetical protein C5E10_06055 [Pseudoclavibacter sp. RFBG4]|uniref:HutD family protein n=1 Tax=Pseudoclavibacter sp. RFBG4 TaxID=2080575 RepID=UPI000CE84C6B|nr:HutD family protein [Pseudoclavibacter sp. RFBG4]PPG35156.1 hypothetical protein C5E10_06055 [Pseudoclavibacter sp. RFBG4]